MTRLSTQVRAAGGLWHLRAAGESRRASVKGNLYRPATTGSVILDYASIIHCPGRTLRLWAEVTVFAAPSEGREFGVYRPLANASSDRFAGKPGAARSAHQTPRKAGII